MHTEPPTESDQGHDRPPHTQPRELGHHQRGSGHASLCAHRRGRTELAKTVPSTEVLRDIANQARHLYAVTARLAAASFTAGHLSEHAARIVHQELREPAQVMHALQQHWGTVTTATKPSHEYVTATTTLHTSLTAIERQILLPGKELDLGDRIDIDQALADLRYAATDLVELTHTAAHLPEPLIRSKVLFAPARILPSTMERIQDRNHGRYVPIDLTEGEALIDAAQKGSTAAQQARATLESSLRATEPTELSAPALASRSSRQTTAPDSALSGPDLF